MTDLDTLRPEVQKAHVILDGEVAPTGKVSYEAYRAWCVIHAELLRLAKENRILEVKNSGTLANNLCSDHRDKQAGRPCLVCLLEHAEAELATLKARIAEAPVGVFGLCYNGHEPGFLGFPQAIDNLPRESMLGKRVRLVVEE